MEEKDRILTTGDSKTGEVTSRLNEIMEKISEAEGTGCGPQALENKLKDYKFEIAPPREETGIFH